MEQLNLETQSRNITPPNNIEMILKRSVELFYETGMPELAQKWQNILVNYHFARENRNNA